MGLDLDLVMLTAIMLEVQVIVVGREKGQGGF